MSDKNSKNEDVDAVVGCLWSIAHILIQLALLPCPAFVMATIWRWFAVEKMGAAPASVAVIGGLMEGASLLRIRSVYNKNDKVTMAGIISGHVIFPAIVLAVARVWLVFA